jgi:hypothetical protein
MLIAQTQAKTRCVLGAIALVAFALGWSAPAWAYGPYEEFGSRDTIKAMVYIRIPLGPSIVRERRDASFGVTLCGEFFPAHPAYRRGQGPYVDSAGTGIALMDLHFVIAGRGSGLDAVGWTILGSESPPE